MTLTLELAPELERDLRKAAAESGIAPDDYILRLVRQDLRAAHAPGRLPHREAELLQQINHSLSAVAWVRYDALLEKRRAESLTPEEQADLVALTDDLEAANARRMEALAELAQLRRLPLAALMTQLGLTPRAHA